MWPIGKRPDRRVHALGAVRQGLGLERRRRRPGNDTTPPENQFEVCIPKRGTSARPGKKGGQGSAEVGPQGLALDSSGDLYVVEGDFSNRRGFRSSTRRSAQKEEAEFLLMFGAKVNATSGGKRLSPARLPRRYLPGRCRRQRVRRIRALVVGSNIAIAPGGKVWVGDEGRIQRFNEAGEYQSQIALAGKTVKALAVDGSGNLYVATCTPGSCVGSEAANPNVRKFSPAGVEETPAFTVANPQALATDAAGNLYVVDGSATIRKFSPARAELESFPTRPRFLDRDRHRSGLPGERLRPLPRQLRPGLQLRQGPRPAAPRLPPPRGPA